MLLTSLEMAQRLEEVDTIHISRHIGACAQLFPDRKSFTMPIGNGTASFTLPSLGRKLNRITGYGMTGPVSEEELVKIENLFGEKGLDTCITLCPLSDPSASQLLALRGYSISHFLNNYVRVLSDKDFEVAQVEGVAISRLSADMAHNFSSHLVAGYRDGGRAEFLLETLGRIAVLREDTSLYIATVEGHVAGSGCMAFIETKKGKVAHLYLDSTLPQYRGRGIQAALLRARLADARKTGVDLASIPATPRNNGSCRNIERAGFSLAYTKTWCIKAHE